MPRSEGELSIDHRASPGLTAEQARAAGMPPGCVSEGTVFESATIMCEHCHQMLIKNLNRERERAFCMQCGGAYICDLCDAERRKPDYVHMPFRQIVELVGSGKATVVTLGVRPVLAPTKEREI